MRSETIFQYNYSGHLDNFVSSIKNADSDAVTETETGYWRIENPNSFTFEISNTGYIRVEHGERTRPKYSQIYVDSAEIIESVLNIERSQFDLSILIVSEDPISEYLDQRSVIEQFGRDCLESNNMRYNELSDSTISVTFLRDGPSPDASYNTSEA